MKYIVKNRIKVGRVEKNLRQEDLANLTDTTRQTIAVIEQGRQIPSYLLAWRIASVLEMNIDELFQIKSVD